MSSFLAGCGGRASANATFAVSWRTVMSRRDRSAVRSGGPGPATPLTLQKSRRRPTTHASSPPPGGGAARLQDHHIQSGPGTRTGALRQSAKSRPDVDGHGTRISSQYHQVRTGGDTAAIAGICNMDRRSWMTSHERTVGRVWSIVAFIAQHTAGFENSPTFAAPRTGSQIERASGLSRPTMSDAANIYIAAKPSSPITAWASPSISTVSKASG